MAKQRYHIGKNGPAPCNAHPERLGGRTCRYGEDRHGTLPEVTARWESEQEAEHEGMLKGSQKAPEIATESERLIADAEKELNDPSPYHETAVYYSEEEKFTARKLAVESLSSISYTPLKGKDAAWSTNGSTTVDRYRLKDGSRAYFKSFIENSGEEDAFLDYDTSTLGASINEVNSYRMAKLLGNGFDELVPETAFRSIDGDIGTLQREVKEDHRLSSDFSSNVILQNDYRKAAILDFVIGNLDRNGENYLLEAASRGPGYTRRNRLRLIDNSFSFPSVYRLESVNMSVFADGYTVHGHSVLSPQNHRLNSTELEALRRAKSGVQDWIGAGTILPDRGQATIARIDHLLERGTLRRLSDYIRENAVDRDTSRDGEPSRTGEGAWY